MASITELLAIMARLRDPERGCPWDLAQDFASIAPYTIEEAYEVADAIERGDYADLREELGDLLLQVVFHARMAEEQGLFDFAGVVAAICQKMIRRHPHVFGDAVVADAAEQTRAWEAHKAQERGPSESLLDGIARGLPEFARAIKLQKRAARAGFDWPELAPVLAKLGEELDELRSEVQAGAPPQRIADELGDVLFVCANLARHLDIDPAAALRATNAKFERRFRRMEQLAREAGQRLDELDLAAQDRLWEQAKREQQA